MLYGLFCIISFLGFATLSVSLLGEPFEDDPGCTALFDKDTTFWFRSRMAQLPSGGGRPTLLCLGPSLGASKSDCGPCPTCRHWVIGKHR